MQTANLWRLMPSYENQTEIDNRQSNEKYTDRNKNIKKQKQGKRLAEKVRDTTTTMNWSIKSEIFTVLGNVSYAQ